MGVITLDYISFRKKCIELQSKLDFQPDLVVGVLNGGGYVVNEFQDVRLSLVRLQRVDNYIKKSFLGRRLLKWLPYSISNALRLMESRGARDGIDNLDLELLKQEQLDFNIASKASIKNILIVDDAIDTGKTMFVVKNNLEQLFPHSNVKLAVISWTIDCSLVKPDYYLFKNTLVRFPWSKDYKGKDFEKKRFSC